LTLNQQKVNLREILMKTKALALLLIVVFHTASIANAVINADVLQLLLANLSDWKSS
jgi:hypothetical protein